MAIISEFDGIDIAVILPCYNEEQTIAGVVADFRLQLPDAGIYVFDNASSDKTVEVAKAAGARVCSEPRKGKGNVVRRMFADIDADIYLMADGDGTYDAKGAPELVRTLIREKVDMVVGARAGVIEDAGRKGHAFGNKMFNQVYGMLFGREFKDIFSGYRAFSRRFVKSFPALSRGFEIETEMSVHASQLMIPTVEIELPYGKRPEGSESKLSTFRDGARILRTFGMLMKETRPVIFFGAFALMFALASVMISWPVVITWLETGLVPRIPTAILATGMMICAFLLAACGLVLDSVSRSRIEQKRILYLSVPALRTQ